MTERFCQGSPDSKAEAFNYLNRFSFHFSKEKRIVKQLLTELTDVELASGTPRNREYQSRTETLKSGWVLSSMEKITRAWCPLSTSNSS